MVEILVACAVLGLLLVLLFSMTSQTTSTVRMASAKMDAFQTARTAFDGISHRVSQATMNTYWDYYNSTNQRPDLTGTSGPTASANFVPATYGRVSDLHFLIQSNTNCGQAVFFEAPQALSNDPKNDQTQGLLNAIGYYVEFGSDKSYRPTVVTRDRYRYRLMQAIQPSENLQVYSSGTTSSWVAGVKATAWPLADNVIALIVWPRKSVMEDATGTAISANYQYDSRVTPPSSPTGAFPIQYAQTPPTVQLTMVVIDEASATRLESGATEPSVIGNALSAQSDSGGKLFSVSEVTQYQKDLNKLTAALTAGHVNYEVFSCTMSLRESKWSQ